MIWFLREFLVTMATVALTRCAYGITLPAGVNNVWTTALRCWANRKSCHVLTLREGSHPRINYEKTERRAATVWLQASFLKKQADIEAKVNKLNVLAASPNNIDLSSHTRVWHSLWIILFENTLKNIPLFFKLFR